MDISGRFERAGKSRLELIIEQMKAADDVTGGMKATDQMAGAGAMNSICSRAEEIVLCETICEDDAVWGPLPGKFWYGNIAPTGTWRLPSKPRDAPRINYGAALSQYKVLSHTVQAEVHMFPYNIPSGGNENDKQGAA